MKNGQSSFFTNKTILFVVPHEDDEVNMAGGMIYWLGNVAFSVHVVFITNGDYRAKAEIRIQEAYDSLHILGVKDSAIHFLGYSDQETHGKEHLYQSENWTSRNGKNATYFPQKIAERYGFRMEASHLFSKDNLINDVELLLKKIHPDIIFAVDFDTHADHRAASLCFEAAIGKIIRKEKYYRPVVFKMFAYPTAYKGYKDFYGKTLPDTRFNTEDYNVSKCQNPYYLWGDRIRFALPEEARTRRLEKNVKYQALKQHRSQSIRSRADRIINGDEVAWLRRTDNLMFDSKVLVSSGNADYLRDFLLFDCSDIMNGDKQYPQFDRGVWIPSSEDEVPSILIELDAPEIIEEIVFYQSAATNQRVQMIGLNYNNVITEKFEYNGNHLVWRIKSDYVHPVNMIKIEIYRRDGQKAGFSEIEIFKKKKESVKWLFPLYRENIIYSNNMCKKYNRSELAAWVYDGVKAEVYSYADLKDTINKPLILRMLEETETRLDAANSGFGVAERINSLFNYIYLKGLRFYYALHRLFRKYLKKNY